MSVASDFIGGLSATSGIINTHKDRQAQKARDELTMQMRLEDRIARQRQDEIAASLRLEQEMRDRDERQTAREDRLVEAAAGRARHQLDAAWRNQTANMLSPKEVVETAVLHERMRGMKLQNDGLADPPTPIRTARVRQPIGTKGAGGFAEYEMPVDQVPNLTATNSAPAYKSPHARRIAGLDKIIASESAAIEGGDRRRGFANLTSREDIVANAQRERLRLLALELEDKVRAGVISQEDADAEADRLLAGSR
jgi:hypothetical protein